jgi:hypothetical protein
MGNVTVPSGSYPQLANGTIVLVGGSTLTIANGATFPLGADGFLIWRGYGTISMAGGVGTPFTFSTTRSRMYFYENVRLDNANGTTFLTVTGTGSLYVEINQDERADTFNETTGLFVNVDGSGSVDIVSNRFVNNLSTVGTTIRVVQKVRLTGTTTNGGNTALVLPGPLGYIPINAESVNNLQGVIIGRATTVPRNPQFTVNVACHRETTAASTTIDAGGTPTATFADGCSATITADAVNAGIIITVAGVAGAGVITWTFEGTLTQYLGS